MSDDTFRADLDALRTAAMDASRAAKQGQFWPPKAEWYSAVDTNFTRIWDALDLIADHIERRVQ